MFNATLLPPTECVRVLAEYGAEDTADLTVGSANPEISVTTQKTTVGRATQAGPAAVAAARQQCLSNMLMPARRAPLHELQAPKHLSGKST